MRSLASLVDKLKAMHQLRTTATDLETPVKQLAGLVQFNALRLMVVLTALFLGMDKYAVLTGKEMPVMLGTFALQM
jgi:hypothetical protein